MSDSEKIYDLGKLVGLNNEEIDAARPPYLKILLVIFVVVALLTIYIFMLTNYGVSLNDPYADNTFYGTIEPKFRQKLRRKIKIAL